MKQAHEFEAYEDNGGSCVAIAGPNFCIVAADTRQSNGYSINCRYAPKSFILNKSQVLGTSGFYADSEHFAKEICNRIQVYKWNHEREMPVASVAQLMQCVLYEKRFFPYYVFNVLGGLDAEGRGAVYSFDPVGSYEREEFRAGGSAASLLQPFLDNRIGRKGQNLVDTAKPGERDELTLEKAVCFVKDAFIAASERDIYTGDCVEIHVITREGIQTEKFALRRD